MRYEISQGTSLISIRTTSTVSKLQTGRDASYLVYQYLINGRMKVVRHGAAVEKFDVRSSFEYVYNRTYVR